MAATRVRGDGGSSRRAARVTGLRETAARVNGHSCRVWEKGEGERVGYLAGIGGLPRLDALPRRAGASPHRRRAVAAGISRCDRPSPARRSPGLAARDARSARCGWIGRSRSHRRVGCDRAWRWDVAAVWQGLVRCLVLALVPSARLIPPIRSRTSGHSGRRSSRRSSLNAQQHLRS